MTTFRSNSSPSALPDKRMMIVREAGEHGRAGRELRFTDLEFDPLDYEHLVNRKLDQPMIIPLAGRGTIVGGDVADTEIGRTGRFRTELQSRFASKSVGLVRGGWLPSAIPIQDDSVVLPDRCVVAELDRRLKDGITKYTGRSDFIDLFADHAIRINPALFALEGDKREHPTAESAKRSLDEAVRKLRSALPKAILVADDANGVKGILGLIEDTEAASIASRISSSTSIPGCNLRSPNTDCNPSAMRSSRPRRPVAFKCARSSSLQPSVQWSSQMGRVRPRVS